MEDKKICKLAQKYRNAIIQAYENGEFLKWPFRQFPDGCCGAASDILGKFLYENGIYTKVVSGKDPDTTHAWLVVDDDIFRDNLKRVEEMADPKTIQEMHHILKAYGYGSFGKEIHPYHSYDFVLDGCTIIDITGSQTQFRSSSQYFHYDIPVYVGPMDAFHNLFDIMGINDFRVNGDLKEVYRIVRHYL